MIFRNRSGAGFASAHGIFYIFFCVMFLCSLPAFSEQSGSVTGGSDEKILSLGLDESIAIAVKNSYDLQEILAREGIYSMAITESLREYFPSLTFSYVQTDEVKYRSPDSRMSRLTAETEMVIYDGGRRGLNYDMARLNALAARNDYRIALNRLVVNIREQYLNLLRLKTAIKIHKRTLERARMQMEFIKKEYELGDATKLAVMEIEAKTKEVELSLKEAGDNYETALMEYRLALRINRHTPVNITGEVESDFTFVPVPDIDPEELIVKAVRSRKEIETALIKSEISIRNHEINRTYYLPNVSVGFNYSLSDEDFPPREKGWGVNLKVTSRLFGNSFSGGAGYNEDSNGNSRALSRNGSVNVLNDMSYKRSIAESRIEMARADDEKKMIRERISLEVASASSALKNSWDMIEITARRLELYDSLLEIERLKADMGESRRFDLLEKEIERGEAAVALLNSRIRYLMAVSALEISIGADVDFLRKYFRERGEKG